MKKRRGFLPLEGEGGSIHDRVDWDGRGDFEDQLVFLAGSLPTFAPEKGSKATFPCQGKEQKLLLYRGNKGELLKYQSLKSSFP
ncbi:hypothetical protein [Arenibacter palladensis]|uniref:hypothetical protein n=1 Tax=Arenibacter palladensis TaxID=237373 RepID=UPI0009339021|nr:hypothetical protein [Arenibacter palladensis]